MRQHYWTEAEDAKLRAHWGTELPITMWGITTRTVHAVRQRGYQLGLGERGKINYASLYPAVDQRGHAILDLLKSGPLPSNTIRERLGITEWQHRRAHNLIRSEIYIFAWEMGAKGGEWPIWALGDAPDAKRPPKGNSTEYGRRYREKHKRPSRAKPKEEKPVFVAPRKADLASSWMFNPC